MLPLDPIHILALPVLFPHVEYTEPITENQTKVKEDTLQSNS